MDLSISKYSLTEVDPTKIIISVSNPTEVKTTLSSYTVYHLRGSDKKGEFQCSRRYSQFDLIRQYLLRRWPGCYVPGLPEKKMVGNSDINFVENRKLGLQIFCQELAGLQHLWYSDEFQIFLRKQGDLQASLKSLQSESHDDIIKKYDEKLSNLRGKSIDTNVISKVLEFNKYLKRTQLTLTSFRQFLVFFSEIKNNNYEQFSILYNYLLPEYEKTCLSNYLNHDTSGRVIFSDENDERMASFVNKIKQMIARHNFDELLTLVQQQQRQVNSFLDVYRHHAVYERKLQEYKEKQKSLQVEQQKLNMGKQGLIKSIFKSNIEQDKKNVERQISVNKDYITTYTLLSDMITIMIGFFEIDRFRQAKITNHMETIKKIAKVQVEFCKLQKQLCNHILDNHNLI